MIACINVASSGIRLNPPLWAVHGIWRDIHGMIFTDQRRVRTRCRIQFLNVILRTHLETECHCCRTWNFYQIKFQPTASGDFILALPNHWHWHCDDNPHSSSSVQIFRCAASFWKLVQQRLRIIYLIRNQYRNNRLQWKNLQNRHHKKNEIQPHCNMHCIKPLKPAWICLYSNLNLGYDITVLLICLPNFEICVFSSDPSYSDLKVWAIINCPNWTNRFGIEKV